MAISSSAILFKQVWPQFAAALPQFGCTAVPFTMHNQFASLLIFGRAGQDLKINVQVETKIAQLCIVKAVNQDLA
jgi:hypothetical protein